MHRSPLISSSCPPQSIASLGGPQLLHHGSDCPATTAGHADTPGRPDRLTALPAPPSLPDRSHRVAAEPRLLLPHARPRDGRSSTRSRSRFHSQCPPNVAPSLSYRPSRLCSRQREINKRVARLQLQPSRDFRAIRDCHFAAVVSDGSTHDSCNAGDARETNWRTQARRERVHRRRRADWRHFLVEHQSY